MTRASTAEHVSAFRQLRTLMESRRSCRAFTDEPVPEGVIEALLNVAQNAASWSNVQPWNVDVVSGGALAKMKIEMEHAADPIVPDYAFPRQFDGLHRERRRRSGWQLYEAVGVAKGDRAASARQAAKNFEFFGAPHAAIITTERDLGVYGAIDCGVYVQSFLLTAASLGIGAVAQAALASRAHFLRRWLDVPDSRVVICAISFGYPDLDDPSAKFRTERAGLSEVVRFHG